MTSSRFSLQYQPTTGFGLLLLVDSFKGAATYRDFTSDMDNPSRTKLSIHSVGSSVPKIVRGFAVNGMVVIDAIDGQAARVRIQAHVVDDGTPSDTLGYDVNGSWRCLIG